ncbi:DUF4912 domain-containing protein [Methylobacter sp.]|uniref:DUF4912 domain-containing protein n=1 Tax=Methylobacter sp. TaxID=2051955 RepID=UPI002FDDC2A4
MTFLHSGYNSKINLSAQEILEISQEISRDFTPCFSSGTPELVEKIRLSSKELFDISEEIGRDYASKVSCTIPEVTLLPVDPRHIYAYWNIGENRETATPDNEHKDQLTLRIYAQPDEEKVATETVSWFDIAIDRPEARQQVSLPDPVDETAYSAAIGKYCADDNFIVFAHSNIIHAPHGGTAWYQDHQKSTHCPSKNASGQGVSK